MKKLIQNLRDLMFDERRLPTPAGWSAVCAVILSGIGAPLYSFLVKDHATLAVWALCGLSIVVLILFYSLRLVEGIQTGQPKKYWGFESSEEIKRCCRVLIVDDRLLPHQDMLERRGFRVTKNDRVAPRDVPIEAEYDIMLLDYKGVIDSFAATDGIAALKTIRQDNPWIPVMIITSYEEDERIAAGSHLYDGVIPKSLEYSEVESRLLGMVDRACRKEFFHARLEKYGISNSKEILGAVEAGGNEIKPSLTEASASSMGAALSLQKIAVSVFNRTRWADK